MIEAGLDRFERSQVGRALLSAVVFVALAGAVVYNLPQSQLRGHLYPRFEPYMNAVGLDQNWGVFAPDPRKQALALEVRINYPAGGSDTWRPPKRGRLIGSYTDYRWQKSFDNAITSGITRAGFFPSAANWVARTRRSGDEVPATISFVKRYADLKPPGEGPHSPLAEAPISEQPIRAQDLRDGR